MKLWKRMQNYSKVFSVALSVAMTLSICGNGSILVKAASGVKASDAATDLYTLSAGAELASGVYYLSQSKTFGSANSYLGNA